MARLIELLIVFFVLAFGGSLIWRAMRPEKKSPVLDRDERAELEDLQLLKTTLRELAWRDRDVNPELSSILLNEIEEYEQKRIRQRRLSAGDHRKGDR